MVGVSRFTSCTVGDEISRHRAISALAVRGLVRRLRGEDPRHHGVAALGAAHRLDHVAEETRVQVAEETDEAAIAVGAGAVHQHVRHVGLEGEAALGLTGAPALVHRLEIPSVQLMRPSSRASTVFGCVPAATRIAAPAA